MLINAGAASFDVRIKTTSSDGHTLATKTAAAATTAAAAALNAYSVIGPNVIYTIRRTTEGWSNSVSCVCMRKIKALKHVIHLGGRIVALSHSGRFMQMANCPATRAGFCGVANEAEIVYRVSGFLGYE